MTRQVLIVRVQLECPALGSPMRRAYHPRSTRIGAVSPSCRLCYKLPVDSVYADQRLAIVCVALVLFHTIIPGLGNISGDVINSDVTIDVTCNARLVHGGDVTERLADRHALHR